MINKSFAILFIFLSSFSFEQKTICFNGVVRDENGAPLEYVAVTLSSKKNERNINTDKNGNFTFLNIVVDLNYFLIVKKDQFLSRTIHHRIDTLKTKDTTLINITLRSRKFAAINTSAINEKDLGMKLKYAIAKYNLDTVECIIEMEPKGIARGIKVELGDSTYLFLQIERVATYPTFKSILNKKIIGIGLAFPNCKTKVFGSGFVWWGISNPYCKN